MRLRLLATPVAFVVLGGSLAANIVVSAEFREIVLEAGLIARGVITDVRSVTVPGGGIDSIATLAIESVVKGEEAPFVSVRLPGGQIGTTRFVMVGVPTLRTGDRAVFLLKRGADGFWRPVGLSQGVYRVKTDALSGRAVVNPPLVAGRTAQIGPVVRGDPQRKSLGVAEFEALIRTITLDRAVRRGGAR